MKEQDRNTPDSSGNDSLNPALEELARVLIEETKGILQSKFNAMFGIYHDNPKALGNTQIKNILFSLLKIAIAQRRLLSGRIQKSVESGSLFQYYFIQMQRLNQSSNETYAKMKRMEKAEKEYLHYLTVYRENYDPSYEVEPSTDVNDSSTEASAEPIETPPIETSDQAESIHSVDEADNQNEVAVEKGDEQGEQVQEVLDG